MILALIVEVFVIVCFGSGEEKCGSMVTVVKAHPTTHSLEQLTKDMSGLPTGKCHHTMKDHGVQLKKVVLLLRDPFDSCWSEYEVRYYK